MFKVQDDMILNRWPSCTILRGCITSAQAQRKSFPQLIRKHAHPLCTLPTSNTWIFIFQKWRWGRGWRWWWWWSCRDEVLSHYMYLSVCVFTCGCHLTWQVYQCPRLIRTRLSAWQAEPTALQSRLTAPQVAGGGGGGGESGGETLDKRGVKEHTNNKRSKLKSVNTLKSSSKHDSSYCYLPEFQKNHLIMTGFCCVTEQLLPNIKH